ncbi:GntR family transcriptional regulator [Leucobacter sp. wl10]|uniref:GntR family transcriptional regulator n=1 Tax=Leucobacter sp. wl10 TaxID=2304677 RepID=UPI0013C31C96|nr:GntR family transcriptional regulator [Leucobacter sp. wl10]
MNQTERIAETIRAEISEGRWPVGMKLPSEKALSERFRVTPGTVRIALRTLVEEGSIDGTRGARKTVIGTPAPPEPFDQFRSFAQWAIQQQRVPGGIVRSKAWVAGDPADAENLGVEAGANVLRIVRLRTLDGEPVMIERTHYREAVGRAVEQLSDDCPSVTVALAENPGIIFARAQHVFAATAASAEDAAMLDVSPGTPLLSHRRISLDRRGVPLEWSEDRYRADVIGVAVGNSWAVNPLRWVTDPGG